VVIMTEKIVFIAKISKVGDRYAIYIPSKYAELAKQLHQKYVRVTIEPVEEK